MSNSSNQSTKRNFIRVLKITVFVLVVVMIVKTVDQSLVEFRKSELDLGSLDIQRLLISAGLYCLGLFCFAYMWHRALCILKQSPTLSESFGSYFLSQLGKYVPGKALVVVIRSERVKSSRTTLATAITAVFIETLSMMAVGAVLGGLFIVFFGNGTHDSKLFWISGLLALAAGVPSAPPVFRAVIGFLSRRKVGSSLPEYVENVTLQTMTPCWLVGIVGWLLLGGSMAACLSAIPVELFPTPFSAADFGVITASVALALVAGFISLVPGGAGVREYIILTLLAGPYGIVVATVVAILLRLIWLAAEVVMASVFYILMKPPKQ